MRSAVRIQRKHYIWAAAVLLIMASMQTLRFSGGQKFDDPAAAADGPPKVAQPTIKATTKTTAPTLYDDLLSNRIPWDSTGNGTKIVWQTWKTRHLPGWVQAFRDNMTAKSPTYDFRIMNDDEMDVFMRKFFAETPVYQVFASLEIGAAKADLWRYCVLFLNGGLYLDMDSTLTMPLEAWISPDTIPISFEGNEWKSYHDWCSPVWNFLGLKFPTNMTFKSPLHDKYTSTVQWFMVYPHKHHPILRHAILLTTILLSKWQERETEDAAINLTTTHNKVVCLTGPGIYTVAIMRALEEYSFDKLHLQLLGLDYQDYANFRCPFKVKRALSRQVGRYTKVDSIRIMKASNTTTKATMVNDFLRQPPRIVP